MAISLQLMEDPSQAIRQQRDADSVHDEAPLRIDCSTCTIRPTGCADCVVSVLIGLPEELDHTEQQAISVLSDSGLIPPLRLRLAD